MSLKQTYKQALLIPSMKFLSQNYLSMRKIKRIIDRDDMLSREHLGLVKTALLDADRCIAALERLEKRLKLFYKNL